MRLISAPFTKGEGISLAAVRQPGYLLQASSSSLRGPKALRPRFTAGLPLSRRRRGASVQHSTLAPKHAMRITQLQYLPQLSSPTSQNVVKAKFRELLFHDVR